MARFDQAAPVLQVSDVSLSIRWYSDILGLEGWTFPKTPPCEFALLRRDGVELMFQRRAEHDGDLLEVAAQIKKKTKLLTEPTRMPYRDVEFSVEDPDGHVIVLSEQLPDGVNVPLAIE